jgi:hypothetical protein
MDPARDQNHNDSSPSQPGEQTIKPINQEETQAYAGQNSPAPQESTESPQLDVPHANISSVYPTPLATSRLNPSGLEAEKEWKPNTTLASRIPALRNYGITLILGSLLFMYINRGIWKFAHLSSARVLGFVIYAILGVALISGCIILLSKSKSFIQLSLNIILGLAILAILLSLISLRIITILLMAMVIGSVINIKQYVKRAA